MPGLNQYFFQKTFWCKFLNTSTFKLLYAQWEYVGNIYALRNSEIRIKLFFLHLVHKCILIASDDQRTALDISTFFWQISYNTCFTFLCEFEHRSHLNYAIF